MESGKESRIDKNSRTRDRRRGEMGDVQGKRERI